MVRLATAAISLAARCISPLVRRVRVEGLSMVPTYAPGEYVWAVRRFLYPGNLQGRVVICPDPDFPDRELVKRVSEIRRTDVSDVVVLGGDNHEASRDSRVFGTVPLRRVTWVVMPNRRPF